MTAHLGRVNVAGAALVILRHDSLVFNKGYGFANVATAEPATTQTAFFIASITKIFTAAAVMTLVEDGKVGLDEAIGSILADPMPDSWRPVTVRQLLAFVGGLTDPNTAPGVTVPTYGEMLDSMRGKPLFARPGEQYRYSQTHYHLLGRLIEARSGQAFESYVEERLLERAGVRSAVFGDYHAIAPGRAEWYSVISVSRDGSIADAPRYILRTDYPRYYYPAAGLHISADELAQWVAHFANGRIVAPGSVSTIWSPTVLSDGTRLRRSFGDWDVGAGPGGRWRMIEGGARTLVAYAPEADLTIALLTNTQGAQDVGLFNRLADACLAPSP